MIDLVPCSSSSSRRSTLSYALSPSMRLGRTTRRIRRFASGQSCASPPLNRMAIRRPLASASAWIFVLRPPRERPTACSFSHGWDCRALAPPAHDKVPCGTAHASERLPTLDPLPDWQSIDRRNFSVRHECSPWGGEDPPGGYCVVKIAFGIMPWMPLVPSTTCVTW
jgi:hypothetical protein